MQGRKTGFDDSLVHSREKGGTLIERKIDFEYLATSRVLEKKKRYKKYADFGKEYFYFGYAFELGNEYCL